MIVELKCVNLCKPKNKGIMTSRSEKIETKSLHNIFGISVICSIYQMII